jgi:DNA-binding response OmpR family regulator
VTEPVVAPLVVIVEDDPAIAEGLSLNLKLQGYRTDVAGDGEAAVPLVDSVRPDLVLLDISLPKQSGIWVLETLRGAGNLVPVIVLSARQDEFDKVAALQLGADDYVTKPFSVGELVARVRAAIRRRGLRTAAHATSAFKIGPTTVDPSTQTLARDGEAIDLSARTVTRAGQPVKLTHLEFELLSFFCRNENRVFSREELLREVWGLRQANPARTVDNFVAQLRAKVEADPERPTHLLTVRGSGYRFVR